MPCKKKPSKSKKPYYEIVLNEHSRYGGVQVFWSAKILDWWNDALQETPQTSEGNTIHNDSVNGGNVH